MRDLNHKGNHEYRGRHEGGRHEGRKHHGGGAKTFRRGRALDFLGTLEVKRETLKQQLETPEFKEIQPILLGELKAVEMIIKEYVRHFELHVTEETQASTLVEEGDEEGGRNS